MARLLPSPAPTLRFALCPIVLAVAAGCSGTGSGGAGDTPGIPRADPLGNGQRVHEVVGPATWANPNDRDSASCKVPATRRVDITGVTVVAVDRFDETGSGAVGNLYVEDTLDDPVPFSGMTVFDPSFTPPDLHLSAGDVADLTGDYDEFVGPSTGHFSFCHTLPEIGGAMGFRFDTRPMTPKTIPLSDLRSYDKARQWLGVLVRVENVALAGTATPDSKNRCNVPIDVGGGISLADQPSISNELFDLDCSAKTKLVAGTKLKSLTGVVTYFYSFNIAPRSADDIVLP
jgi:hypothetical protein